MGVGDVGRWGAWPGLALPPCSSAHLLSLPLYLHGLPPASTPEPRFTKEKIKQPWNAKCIIQLQPKRPSHPRGEFRFYPCQR